MEVTEYLTTNEAAAYVGNGVSSRTIVAWIHSGRLKAIRNPSKRGRFWITEQALLEAMRFEPK